MLVPDSPTSSSSAASSPSSSPRLHSPPLFAAGPDASEDGITAPIVNRSHGHHSHHHSAQQSNKQRHCRHGRSRHLFRSSQEGSSTENNIVDLSTDMNAATSDNSRNGSNRVSLRPEASASVSAEASSSGAERSHNNKESCENSDDIRNRKTNTVSKEP